jgi:hypothetical protein
MDVIRKTACMALLPLALGSLSCGDTISSDDVEEIGQQVGDVMASIDESGGSGGGLAMLEATRRTYARLAPAEIQDSWIEALLLPSAHAASCATGTFAACSSNVITRTFSGCTIGTATFDGTVTLTFSDAASDSTCALASSGHSVTRAPNFTVTGRRGATLAVTKTGTNGQVITRGSGSTFSFTNDGIRRAFTNASGTTTFDFTTQTTSAITVTGTARAARTLSGGSLRVTNNLTQVTCDYVPSSVTWASTCNCPTSGSWSGSCSDGKSTSLSITGCGTGSITVDSTTASFSFDRCYGAT